ncbi:HTTM domain-containing protein [Solirubrobacter soli]|uniref:HTTM domain-containing protein n=1 Tax=Solirubrobacter soli TaxID=363832 RepID=UPI0004889BC9
MIRRAWHRWDRFWFAPVDPLPLGLVRIALGVVMTLWTLTLLPQLPDFFTARGVTGSAAAGRPWHVWTLLGATPSPTWLGAVCLAMLVAAIALTAGWHTRVASIIVCLGAVSLQRTDPYVFNSGDSLLRLLCLFVALAPAGACLSLDARRRGPRSIPAWPLRLIQIQVSVMYLAAVWAKLRGPAWRDGSATEYALRVSDLVRFPVGDLLDAAPWLVPAATYGTMAIEAALVVLVWPRRTRPFALLAGVTLHLGIDLGLRVGFFTLAVFTAYLAFVDRSYLRPFHHHLDAQGSERELQRLFRLLAQLPRHARRQLEVQRRGAALDRDRRV